MFLSSRRPHHWLSVLAPMFLVAASTPSLAQSAASKPTAKPALIGWAKGTTEGVFVAGGYFPGLGWRAEEYARSFAFPGTLWTLMNLTGTKAQFATDRAKLIDGPPGYFAEVRANVDAKSEIPQALALSAPHAKNAQPRLPRAQSLNQPLYAQAAAKLLRSGGLKLKSARLTQLLRIDLNGDGTEEVLISAHSRPHYGRTPEVKKGDYNLTAIRFVHKGQVKIVPIDVEIARKATAFSAPNRSEFLAFADIDGDSTMEIVLSTGYYEGWGMEFYKFDGQKVSLVLGAGWGA